MFLSNQRSQRVHVSARVATELCQGNMVWLNYHSSYSAATTSGCDGWYGWNVYVKPNTNTIVNTANHIMCTPSFFGSGLSWYLLLGAITDACCIQSF